MNEIADILTKVELVKGHRFFAIGEWPELTTALRQKGWPGIILSNSCGPLAEPPAELPLKEAETMTVHALAKLDPHFVRVGSDVLVRPVTPQEFLGVFAGPWRFGLVNVPGLNREIACSDGIWAAWPNVLVVKHGGEDQHIANLCSEHGYRVMRLTREELIMERPKQPNEP